MPLKLVPPRTGKSPNYRIRGTYLGQYVDSTAGTPDRKKAGKVLAAVKDDIERGRFARKGPVTYADAATAYLDNGGDETFLERLTEHFGVTPLHDIDQAAIDQAAMTLYPDATPATRNRQVYTPMSAILKHAGIDFAVKRPRGAQGQTRTEWCTPEQAERLLNAAEKTDREFRVFLATLLYTGLRLSEGLSLECDRLELPEAFLYVPDTKNGEPRAVHLPPPLVAELTAHPRGLDRRGEPLFRFHKNGHLYGLMRDTRKTAGLASVSFHTLRHTWATWMRRYAGLDTKGLVGTGAWKDEKSAARYSHVVVTEEAKRADLLPVLKRANSGKSVD